MTAPNRTLSSTVLADFQLLRSACREAGELAHDYFKRGVKTELKSDGTVVSAADLAVDALLKERLHGPRPKYGWLSEETTDDLERLSRSHVWIVDPIDGTQAFVNNKPNWVVSAALVVNGTPALGVIYSPVTDEWFEAAVGQGASYNNGPARCTTRKNLQDAVIYAPKSTIRPEKWPSPWPPVELKWVNSIAYRVCLVANGQADASISLNPKSEWDMAAADILIREAGGAVADHLGAPYTYNQRKPQFLSVVAAGAALHQDLIDRTKKLRIITS